MFGSWQKADPHLLTRRQTCGSHNGRRAHQHRDTRSWLAVAEFLDKVALGGSFTFKSVLIARLITIVVFVATLPATIGSYILFSLQFSSFWLRTSQPARIGAVVCVSVCGFFFSPSRVNYKKRSSRNMRCHIRDNILPSVTCFSFFLLGSLRSFISFFFFSVSFTHHSSQRRTFTLIAALFFFFFWVTFQFTAFSIRTGSCDKSGNNQKPMIWMLNATSKNQDTGIRWPTSAFHQNNKLAGNELSLLCA